MEKWNECVCLNVFKGIMNNFDNFLNKGGFYPEFEKTS